MVINSIGSSDGASGDQRRGAETPNATENSAAGQNSDSTLTSQQSQRKKQVATTRDDSEFLPAALEILVTPLSPIATWLITLICLLVFSGVAWGYFGWLDIIVVAPGRIHPSGHTKVVQPVEPGKVTALWVANGSHVRADDLLLELDPTETAADQEAVARDLEAASAEVARRRAAIASAVGAAVEAKPIEFDGNTKDSVRRREQVVFAADHAQLTTTIKSLNAQLFEKQATKQRLQLSGAARERLITLSRERVKMRQELEGAGAGSRALIIEALQQLETQLTTQANEHGEQLEADAAISSIEHKRDLVVTQFLADQAQKLAEVERKKDHLEQELIKARSKLGRMQLRAPIDGTVAQLGVTTMGQVVAAGQSLLTIVPVDGPIEVEAMIANKDIGFVQLDQIAAIKIEAFPFTHYGTIEGRVINVSRDAVDDREATNMTDASTATRLKADASSPVARMQNLVFPATLSLDTRTIMVDGKEIALSAGMVVSVEIKTGQRRAIDYILSPLREVATRAAHER